MKTVLSSNHGVSRRAFLGKIAAGASAVTFPWPIPAAESDPVSGILQFGIIADVHQDIMHDSEQRLRSFVDHMKAAGVDFILQLGDFCTPIPANKAFLDIWQTFEGPRYHVLGNHDTDGGYSREQTVNHWKMPARYYSFDVRGAHCVVLDGNDPGPGQKPYYRYLAEEQARWLEQDLAAARLPVLVFIHQPIDHEQWGIANHAEIRTILEKANQPRKKVAACFSGHLHRDYCRIIGDIPYIQINSAAYFWIGSRFAHQRYSPEIEKKHPMIKNTVPYKEPLWAKVTVDFGRHLMRVEGRSTEFVGPSPWELGADREEFEAATISPAITSRQFLF